MPSYNSISGNTYRCVHGCMDESHSTPVTPAQKVTVLLLVAPATLASPAGLAPVGHTTATRGTPVSPYVHIRQ